MIPLFKHFVLGAFEKLLKLTVGFDMFARLSMSHSANSSSPLDGL